MLWINVVGHSYKTEVSYALLSLSCMFEGCIGLATDYICYDHSVGFTRELSLLVAIFSNILQIFFDYRIHSFLAYIQCSIFCSRLLQGGDAL